MSTRKNFDLERFPENCVSQRMVSRVSPIYERSYVAKWLYEVMGREVDDAEIRFSELREQANPETATWALRYWEQRYGIEVDESRSLAARRADIIARRGVRAPMNPARMEKILGDMTNNKVVVEDWIAPYTFGVYIYAEKTVDVIRVNKKIKKIKPSHLAYRLIVKCEPTTSPFYVSATPCSTSISMTVRLPGTIRLKDIHARAHVSGGLAHMHETITIKIGGTL